MHDTPIYIYIHTHTYSVFIFCTVHYISDIPLTFYLVFQYIGLYVAFYVTFQLRHFYYVLIYSIVFHCAIQH